MPNSISLIKRDLPVVILRQLRRRQHPHRHRRNTVIRDTNQTISLRIRVLGTQRTNINIRIIDIDLILRNSRRSRRIRTRQRRISLISQHLLTIRHTITIRISLRRIRTNLTLILIRQPITISINNIDVISSNRTLEQLRRLTVVRGGVNNIYSAGNKLVHTIDFYPRQRLEVLPLRLIRQLNERRIKLVLHRPRTRLAQGSPHDVINILADFPVALSRNVGSVFSPRNLRVRFGRCETRCLVEPDRKRLTVLGLITIYIRIVDSHFLDIRRNLRIQLLLKQPGPIIGTLLPVLCQVRSGR